MRNIPVYSKDSIEMDLRDGDGESSEFSELIETILDGQVYDNDTQRGILLLIKDEGTEILSKKQRGIIQSMLNDYSSECDRCGEDIQWSQIDIFQTSDYCSSCQRAWDKMNDE